MLIFKFFWGKYYQLDQNERVCGKLFTRLATRKIEKNSKLWYTIIKIALWSVFCDQVTFVLKQFNFGIIFWGIPKIEFFFNLGEGCSNLQVKFWFSLNFGDFQLAVQGSGKKVVWSWQPGREEIMILAVLDWDLPTHLGSSSSSYSTFLVKKLKVLGKNINLHIKGQPTHWSPMAGCVPKVRCFLFVIWHLWGSNSNFGI